MRVCSIHFPIQFTFPPSTSVLRHAEIPAPIYIHDSRPVIHLEREAGGEVGREAGSKVGREAGSEVGREAGSAAVSQL
jgi:hypothetical protein